MNYYITERFTLVPTDYANEDNSNDFKKIFEISSDESVASVEIENISGRMIYSLPLSISQQNDSPTYPFAHFIINYLPKIKGYNKVVFHYSSTNRLVHITVAKSDNLELINTYEVDSFNSALYFLFLAVKQTITNPLQTKVHVLSSISQEEKLSMSQYFSDVILVDITSEVNFIEY